MLSRKELIERLKDVRLLASDFDGVFTNGQVWVDEKKREMVCCNRRDTLLMGRLQKLGVEIHVISTEAHPIVLARCEKMDVGCDQAIEDGEGKLKILQRLAGQLGLKPEQVVYMGDDLNDVAPIKWAGIGITVADGHPAVREIADYETEKKGGDGAVREVIELIFASKGVDLSSF